MLDRIRNTKELIKSIIIYRFFPPFLYDPSNKIDRIEYSNTTVTIRSRIVTIILSIILYCIGFYTVLFRNDMSIHNTNFIVLLVLFVSVVYFMSITTFFITYKILLKVLKTSENKHSG